MGILTNGSSSREVFVPYGQTVSFALADTSLSTSLLWEILPPEYDDGTETDAATCWPGWTFSGGVLSLTDNPSFAAVTGKPDVPDSWLIRCTETQAATTIVHTSVIRVRNAQTGEAAPAPAENDEASAVKGWWRNERKGKKVTERVGQIRVYNGTGSTITNKVCKVSGQVDFRTVAGNANPGGTASKAEYVDSITVAGLSDANVQEDTLCWVEGSIANGAFGWARVKGKVSGDFAAYTAGDAIYLGTSGTLSSTPSAVRLGRVTVASASGYLTMNVKPMLAGLNYAQISTVFGRLGQTIQLSGVTTAGDGGQGSVVAVTGATTSNGATVFAGPAASGMHWERVTGDAVFARWFGAKADGGTYTTEMQAAINYALGFDPAYPRTLILPRGAVLTSTLTIDDAAYGFPVTGITVKGEGVSGNAGYMGYLKYNGPAEGTLLDIVGTSNFRIEDLVLDGNNLTKKICWIRPKYVGALLTAAPYNGNFVDVAFRGFGDYAGSVGCSVGDPAYPGIQVSELRYDHCEFYSSRVGRANIATGWRTETNGNVKNFFFNDCSFASLGVGIDWASAAGTVNVYSCRMQSNALDYRLAGQATITSSPSEGSDKFLETPSGSSPCSVGVFNCSADMTGAVDYCIEFGGHLTLSGNEFSNVVPVVGTVKEFRLQSTGPFSSLDSKGNCYLGSTSLPLYRVNLRLLGGPDVSSELDDGNQFPDSINDVPLQSWGDKGNSAGLAGALTTKFPSIIHPFPMPWKNGPSTRTITSGGAGWRDSTGVGYPEQVAPGTWRVRIAKEAFYAAALTQTVAVFNIWTKTKVKGCWADVTTAFAGVAGLTMSVGEAATPDVDHFLVAWTPTAGQRGFADSDLGAGLARATAVQGGVFFYDFSAGTFNHKNQVTVTLTGAANLGNGTVTNLTAGSVDLFFSMDIFTT